MRGISRLGKLSLVSQSVALLSGGAMGSGMLILPHGYRGRVSLSSGRSVSPWATTYTAGGSRGPLRREHNGWVSADKTSNMFSVDMLPERAQK